MQVSAGGIVGGPDAGNGPDDDGLVVDYMGDPVDKSSTGGWLAAALITGTCADACPVFARSRVFLMRSCCPGRCSQARSSRSGWA